MERRNRQGDSEAAEVFQLHIFSQVFGGRMPCPRWLGRICRLLDRIRAFTASVLPRTYFASGVVWQFRIRSGDSRPLRCGIGAFRPCSWTSSSTILEYCNVFCLLCALRRCAMEVANAHS